MYRIRKMFKFEAAHQLDRAFSRACTDSIHGHSYVVEVFLTAERLDEDLMVTDFGRLGEVIAEVKREWDHALFLSPRRHGGEYANVVSKIVELEDNPTAELMAKVLFDVFTRAVAEMGRHNNPRVERVRVHETATGWAEYDDRTGLRT